MAEVKPENVPQAAPGVTAERKATGVAKSFDKGLTYGKLPINILAFLVAMAVTLVAFFAACQILGIPIVWYMVVAAIVLGFFVCFAAMYGFDKLKQTMEQLDSIKQKNV